MRHYGFTTLTLLTTMKCLSSRLVEPQPPQSAPVAYPLGDTRTSYVLCAVAVHLNWVPQVKLLQTLFNENVMCAGAIAQASVGLRLLHLGKC